MTAVVGRRVRRSRAPGLKSISRRERAVLDRAREAADGFENKMFAAMYVEALTRRLLHNDSSLYRFLGSLEQPPVDIETFLDDPQFLGGTDLTLWPEVRKAIIEINRDWWKGSGHGAYHEGMCMGATGCVDEATEFLTPSGWKRVADYRDGDLVAVYEPCGAIRFEAPREYVKAPCVSFLRFTAKTVDQALTLGHRFIYRSPKTGELLEKSAVEVAHTQNTTRTGFRGQIVTAFNGVEAEGLPYSDNVLRLIVAVAADGSFDSRTNTTRCRMRLKRADKQERIRSLLSAAGVEYSEAECSPYGGFRQFVFDAPLRCKSLGDLWGASLPQLGLVAEECLLWDGETTYRDRFFTGDKASADFVQYAFSCTGRTANISTYIRDGVPEYTVLAQNRDYVTISAGGTTPRPVLEERLGDGFCYCFRTSTSMWVSRRGGKIAVTGNTGKTEVSKITTAYHAYILGCLKQPQKVYGLPKSTSIVFPIMAAKPHVTKKVVYQPLRKLIEDIPWFQQHMPMDKQIESEITFPDKNVRIALGGADADSILGEAVIGGIIDEINFMNVVLKSKKAEVTSGRAGVYDQAQNIYEAMTRRKKSRFISQGPMVGIVMVASSTRYSGDFTDKRLKHIAKVGEKGVYVYNKKQYEVAPAERYCGDTFRLLVGNDILSDTRVLKADEEVPDGSMVLDVPIEYREDFLKNPHDSLRDVIGMSTNSVSPFFRRRFKVLECIQSGEEEGLRSFLLKDNVILGVDGMPEVETGHYCLNPSRPRYVHIDLSLTGDRAAIAMLRFDGLKRVEHESGLVEDLPECSLELAATIEPDSQNEIQIAEIRLWVKMLRDKHGYPIKVVTYDGFQSAESRQQWRKEGMKTGHVSVDRTSVPYKQLRDGINDTRIKMIENEVLTGELFDLEYDTVKDKVDHPVNGGKDLADALCGAYTTLINRRSSWLKASADDRTADAGTERKDYGERHGGERFV